MQLQLFDDDNPDLSHVTNVASVPQRSPFRYPGGKTWLIPQIRTWLAALPQKPAELIEPFAGGAVISLTAAAERLVDHVTMVELDEAVASVWQTVINDDGGAEWLAEAILNFDFQPGAVKTTLERTDLTVRERALQTILKNRVNRGGIMAPGAGMLKEGEAGKGLRSRWYPETLKNRILKIAAHRDHISFVQGDGFTVVHENISRKDAVFFIDPPYTASRTGAGARLYTHSEIDHQRLFEMAAVIAGDWLMSYENAEEVRVLAHRFQFDVQVIAMKNTHHAKKTELLIGRNLNWLRP